MKYIYVSTGKILEFRKWDEFSNKKPMGWVRLDLLKKRLKKDKEYKSQFTKEEIIEITSNK